jgi:hypothetical protein
VIVIPHVRVDLGARDDAASIAHEVLEERVLLGREHDVASAASRRMTLRVHDEIGNRELVREDVAASPDECAEAREELAEVEGLREVVVGSGIETLDLVVDGVAGREHEHGGVAASAADLTADVDTVANGEDDVQDDGVVVVDGREKDCLAAVGGVVDGVRCLTQSARDRFAQLTIILGEQNSHDSSPSSGPNLSVSKNIRGT